MKKLILLVTFAFTLPSSVQADILVKSISSLARGPRQGTFNLKNSFLDRNPVLLDCHSFLFGLTFDPKGEKRFFQLYQDECYQVYEDVKSWTRNSQKACLKVDFESARWSLEKQTDACEASAY